MFASPRSHQLVQAYWRGYACRKLLKKRWLRQLQACLSSSNAVDILAAGNPVLPLFHRVFRADSPADLPILDKISIDFSASILRKGRDATDVDRAIFYTVQICSAILRTIEAQRYSNTVETLCMPDCRKCTQQGASTLIECIHHPTFWLQSCQYSVPQNLSGTHDADCNRSITTYECFYNRLVQCFC